MTNLFTPPVRILQKRQNWVSFNPELFTKRGNWCLAIGLLCLSAAEAYAGGTGLPWDGPIEKIAKGLSGPVAFLFALGGMVVLGVRWLFGGDMGAMTRSLLTAVAGIALLVFAADFLADLFGVTSALIAG